MDYLSDIRAAKDNPKQLEDIYQFALQEKAGGSFRAALLACYEETPANLLYAAWFHRLEAEGLPEERTGRAANWKLAIPLALVNGLLLWLVSDDDWMFYERIPIFFVLAPAIVAVFVMAFLSLGGKREKLPAVWIGLGLLALPAYVYALTGSLHAWMRNHYMDLSFIHVPLLAWVGVGWSIVWGNAGAKSRFAFILKSFEIFVTGGLFMVAGGIFGGITVSMFEALGVDVPNIVYRLVFAGGFGMLPVIVVALAYDPLAEPLAQTFGQGVSRLMPPLVRLLLPLTFVVLVIYIVLIPFNFREPFENRDVLIVYNGMLFAVMGLLLGATPLRAEDVPANLREWVRRGIVAVAVLAAIISVYALTAVVSRTLGDRITINRLTVIGWNVTNIALLITLIFKQFKHGRARWVASLHETFSAGSVAYLAWGAFIIFVTPWLFR